VGQRAPHSPQARYATLEKLVRSLVLDAAVREQRLLATDAQLARALLEDPTIAALRNPDGSLDTQAYRTLLGVQGLTPEGFEAGLRRDLSKTQVMGGITASAFATAAQVQQALDALEQQREVQVARFDAAAYAAQVQPSEADLQAWYAANTEQFRQSEAASVEYVLLDLPAVEASIAVTEDEAREHYQQNLARLAAAQERHVRHILINAAQDTPAQQREQAREQAQALREQLRQAPQRFAELAREHSQDSSSAKAGGDLGYIARGAMPEPFEDAAFAMAAAGDISEVVESDFGYHIIQLADIKDPETPSFEAMRAQMEAEIRRQKAQTRFAELAESFANTVYEQDESLQAVADAFQLTLHRAEGVTRQPQGRGGVSSVLDEPRFLQALFSDDILTSGRSTDAVELGTHQIAAGRVTAYTPARILPLEEAGEQLRTLYVAQQSAERAKADGTAQLAQWQAQPDGTPEALSEPLTISRRQMQGQPPELVAAALRAPSDTLPAWVGVDLGPQGYAVVKVKRIVPAPPPEEHTQALYKQELTQWMTAVQALAYYELLKQQFKVQIKVPRPLPAGALLS